MPPSEALQQQRAEELALFYQKHHPRKVEDARRLVDSFDFEDIRKALMRKYGTLPIDWDPRATLQLKTEVRSFETKNDEIVKGKVVKTARPYTVFNIHVVATTTSLEEDVGSEGDSVAGSKPQPKSPSSEKRWVVQKRYSELRLVQHLLRDCRLPSDAPFPPAIPSILINDALLEVSVVPISTSTC